jgi:ATP-dependent Clp protease adaptor protein ClpS
MSSPATIEQTQASPLEDADIDTPWQTVVWNDPVNLMSYVTYVFQQLFGFSKDKATKLMMDVHTKGKAIVTSGSKDKMEIDVTKLHSVGLWATMEKTPR